MHSNTSLAMAVSHKFIPLSLSDFDAQLCSIPQGGKLEIRSGGHTGVGRLDSCKPRKAKE